MQRLLAYGERLRREEAEAVNPEAGRACHPARPHRPMAGQQWPEAADRRIPMPPAADGGDDIRAVGWTRQLQAEERIYVEPLGTLDIGHRPLDLGIGQPILTQATPAQAQPMSLHREAPVYEDHYRAAPAPRTPNRTGTPVQHRLAKLDTFKGEIGDRLDDFIYQVEGFAAFHAWEPVETCRQARTHLRSVVLAYIRRTALPPRDWTELKDLLTRRFQPRDLTAAYKAQFRTRCRQKARTYPHMWMHCKSWRRWHGLCWTL